jgi:hypothetical protein
MYLLEPNEFNKNYTTVECDIPKSQQQLQFCEDLIKSAKRTTDSQLIQAYKNNYKVDNKKDEDILELAKELKDKLSKYLTYLRKRTEFRDVLTKSAWSTLINIQNEVNNNVKANELLSIEKNYPIGLLPDHLEVYNEFEIYWKDPVTNLDCKSALDRVVIDHNNKTIQLIDLKTTSDLSNFRDSYNTYKYYKQLAFYWMALTWYFKNTLNKDIVEYKNETYIIAVQSKEYYECKAFTIPESELSIGFEEIKDNLKKLEWHYTNNKWDHSREYYDNNGIETI